MHLKSRKNKNKNKNDINFRKKVEQQKKKKKCGAYYLSSHFCLMQYLNDRASPPSEMSFHTEVLMQSTNFSCTAHRIHKKIETMLTYKVIFIIYLIHSFLV